MAKKKINKFVFEPGISKDSNLYPKAHALLVANKAFIQAQVVAFINAQIDAGTPPYNSYTYESSKCTRDVGFFIDAIAHDLRYGGNVKIRQVSDYFWIDGRPMIRGDVSPEITGQQYIRDIINNFIFTNTAVSPSYGQGAIVQTFYIGEDAEDGAAARITAEFALLGDVIENGITAIPEKVSGVSSIRVLEKYNLSDILLITDTSSGTILYNFSDPATSISLEYKNGRSSGDGNLLSDVDFRKWWQTTDNITTIYLSAATSSVTDSGSIQIFVDNDETITRPWDFGTDAIERIRVSNPQAMLDADFEYGIQPTKWQQFSLMRSYPSVYEVPGTDYDVESIVTDASEETGNFGSSKITVTTSGFHNLVVGDPITIKGLSTAVPGYSRAEGSFIVADVLTETTFDYYSSARVGTTSGDSLFTNNIQLRKGGFYTGAGVGNPTFAIASAGTSVTVDTVFDTPSGVDRIAFNGTSPDTGSQVTGTGIAIGTSVAGTVGTSTVSTYIAEDTIVGQTFVVVEDTTGVQANMAVSNGLGEQRLITSIVGNRLNLDDSYDAVVLGTQQSFTNVTGTLRESIGVDAAFTVLNNSDGTYTVTGRDDSTANGQNFAAGDRLTILGSAVGNVDGVNDITIIILTVDSGGSIDTFQHEGTAVAGINTESLNVSATVVTPLPGAGAIFNISKSATDYEVDLIVAGGTNYAAGNIIKVVGTDIGGSSPANDIEITVLGVGIVSGDIQSVDVTSGNAQANLTPFLIYPSMVLSETTTTTIPAGTTLSAGSVATVEVTFDNAHGLVPGTSLLVNITSSPPPVITETNRTISSSGDWYDAVYTTTGWFAIRRGSNVTSTSIDGSSWTAGTSMPNSNNWESLAYGDVGGTNYLVAVAFGTNTAAWSDDNGNTWNTVTLPTVTNTNWHKVAYHNGVFVAVREASTGAAYSNDGGQTWNTGSLPDTSNWQSVVGGRIGNIDYFVAIASNNSRAAYSTDGGATWISATLPSNVTWRDVTFGNSRFVAIATGTANAAYSTNGALWNSTQFSTSTTWESIAYDGNVFLAVSRDTLIATSKTAESGSWTEVTVTDRNFYEVSYGGIGSDKFIAVGNSANITEFTLVDANHNILSGPSIVTSVPTATTIRYPARTIGTISTANGDIEGTVYTRPDAFYIHRPYDGGVQLGTGGPQHGAQAVRQSKKYIRYQSGKGIMYTTGALFAPSYNILSMTADGTDVGSTISVTIDDVEHGVQAGGVIEIVGAESFEYNGTYTVSGITDSKTFRIAALTNLSSTTATLGPQVQMLVKNWHGATVRTGPFDDQNGLFFQYDGQTMAVGKRSSTLQLAGTVTVEPDSNLITGSSTRFQDQLRVGERIVLKGMSHTVTSIASQTSMTVNPDYRGVDTTTGAIICKTEDTIIPQSDWNLDPLDGTGPSGYDFVPTRMQMIGMQYSWYAAGFIEFMLRGSDGKFIFFHRIRNSNVNTEAYMRTANLPVRYEVVNEGAKSYLLEAMDNSQTTIVVADPSNFPENGVVYIDQELITYSGKSGNTLTNCTRASTLSNFAAGQNRVYTGGVAATHALHAGVILVDCTISPAISHWGSALLTDGYFDFDRGYLFSYTASGLTISTTPYTAFLIRLAPSVSNALIGDLGERELLNRAQLLLKEIAITANAQAIADQGGIVIEGVLNPQNYPLNPGDISWTGLSGLAQGGQPSFAQIAPGGSVNWNSGAGTVTRTATVSANIDTGFVYSVYFNGERNSPLEITRASWDSAGVPLMNSIMTSQSPSGYTGTGGGDYVAQSIGTINNNYAAVNFRSTTGRTSATTNLNTGTTVKFVYQTYTGFTNRLLFTESSWNALGASLGTVVSDSKFPAGTAVQSISKLTHGSTSFYEVTFNQTSISSISAGNTIEFDFTAPPYAQPGETVFSFIANPGELSNLDLSELKELTTTAIGGRGTYPNGPDVLAINVYKVAGTDVTGNIILRWGEAQA